MELWTLPPGLRLEEAGPEGAFSLDLLGGEEVLDAHAAGLEGTAASDERIGSLQGIQGKENPGRGQAACEPRSMASEMGRGAPCSLSTRKDVSRSLREAAESGREPGGALSTKLRRM